MYISRFQLLNYKSFRDSGVLEFQPGIHIIVGVNNSGKTALLEALTLSFKTSPHRSIETLPQRNSTPIRKSVANVTLIFTKAEIHTLFDNLSPNCYVGLSSASNPYTRIRSAGFIPKVDGQSQRCRVNCFKINGSFTKPR